MSVVALFVGGPEDGRTEALPHHRPHITRARIIYPMSLPFDYDTKPQVTVETDRYWLDQQLQNGGFAVYRHESIGRCAALKLLITNYRPLKDK